ncbi:MAG: helix-turn-helix transcriptional regulator [Nitrospiraceae bacterium]|nr:helix-turn-helix transcriptional regulator [Nitrospiraceae bacterium]
MNDIQKVFGKRVRELRLKKGLSQENLAEMSGLHWTYIGSVERGERNISLKNIKKISDALGIRMTELFEGVNSSKNKNSK